MSEKTRKKKDGEDKNKNNQRMREANENTGTKNAVSSRDNKKGSSQSNK
jgi:hypothetical protein